MTMAEAATTDAPAMRPSMAIMLTAMMIVATGTSTADAGMIMVVAGTITAIAEEIMVVAGEIAAGLIMAGLHMADLRHTTRTSTADKLLSKLCG
jgi:hypothetical protein